MKKNFEFFPVEDPLYGEVWMTELKSIDMNRTRRVYDDRYILRAVFQEKPMEEEAESVKKTFVVDFTLVRRRSGRWRVTDPALFKIGDEQLFEYGEDHKREALERYPKTTVFSFGEEDGRDSEVFHSNDPFVENFDNEFQEGEDPFAAPVAVKKSTEPPKRPTKGLATGPNADGPNLEGSGGLNEEDEYADKIFQ